MGTGQHDRLGGLVGRGALTAVAALALAGGGTGVAFAGDVPGDGGPEASQGQDHGDDCSCEGHDGGQDQDFGQDQDWWQDQDGGQDEDGWQDQDEDGGRDHDGQRDSDDPDSRSDSGSDAGSDSAAPDRPDGRTTPTHHRDTTGGSGRQSRSDTPTTEKIPHGGSRTETVPITSGVMR
jgi:hypothetical protein